MSSEHSHRLLQSPKTTDGIESDENETTEQLSQNEDKFLVDFSSEQLRDDDDSHELLTMDQSQNESDEQNPSEGKEIILGLNGYQLFALFAAWLGWGFDIFDGLLFNYVAPILIPYLLDLEPDTQETKETVAFWTATLTRWGIGGVMFGKLTDIFGRSKVMMTTILVYALCTAACALAPNLWFLIFFRFLSALGIGGEWAAGATLVRESMPPHRRVLGGALLYTSAPIGLFLATFVTWIFTGAIEPIANNRAISWRIVFLTALLPVFVTLLLRIKLKEPDSWVKVNQQKSSIQRNETRTQKFSRIWREEVSSVKELFNERYKRNTLGGLVTVVIALITWWSCTSFIPLVANYLAVHVGEERNYNDDEMRLLKSHYVVTATSMFNVGGLIGTLLTVPIAERYGRQKMFLIYFFTGAASVFLVFSPAIPWAPLSRLYLMSLLGLTVFGIFGSFTFYLPELYPIHLRAFGSGFCYNSGRIVTAIGPFVVGMVANSGVNPMTVIQYVSLMSLLGGVITLLKVPPETRNHLMDD